MTNEQQQQLIIQLERAAEIMRSNTTEAEKINTLETIGAICSYQARKWGDETYNRMLDGINQVTA